jgi:hypothetical protein
MTMSTWKFVALTLAMALACGFLMGQTRSGVQTAPPLPPQQTGRFQIVNGTPTMSRNIMLLDTWTGDTWITCGEAPTAWCPIQYGVQATK